MRRAVSARPTLHMLCDSSLNCLLCVSMTWRASSAWLYVQLKKRGSKTCVDDVASIVYRALKVGSACVEPFIALHDCMAGAYTCPHFSSTCAVFHSECTRRIPQMVPTLSREVDECKPLLHGEAS
jgi:hypothetical protein